ncbi:MAG: NepR family anti-sigma factor [Alphaproteobacteria bacterium]
MSDENTPPRKRAKTMLPDGPRATVDRWFDAQLNQLYSDVVNEPLPDELAQLVAKLKKRTTET